MCIRKSKEEIRFVIKVIIGIDDTDNQVSRGTGSIATEMCEMIADRNWGTCGVVTRHQLYLHPDIAYTSHNSAMIFDAEVREEIWDELRETLTTYIHEESAEGSDPGICMGVISQIKETQKLIEFGYSAKRQVRTKDEAYALAKLCGLSLTEEGGTGIGVIGALAGVGLRYEGNDGEVKGSLGGYQKNDVVLVKDLLQEAYITRVCNKALEDIPEHTPIRIHWRVKPMLSKGKPILLVQQDEAGTWSTLSKENIREFSETRTNTAPCKLFDTYVEEEQVEEKQHGESCFNCRYRRWTEQAFTCMKGKR